MTAADVIAALDLPVSTRVDQRVPKKLLAEHGAPTAADKRRINDGIEEVQWLAALKANTIAVPSYRDELREYLEIAVLSAALRAHARADRLGELVHRAVPYPVVLIVIQGEDLAISLAHKRWSQNQASATVLIGNEYVVATDSTSGTWFNLSTTRRKNEVIDSGLVYLTTGSDSRKERTLCGLNPG